MPEYEKQVWVDRIVADDTGEVLQVGTIVNAKRMNHIEEGIESCNATITLLVGGTHDVTFQTMQQAIELMEQKVAELMGLGSTVNNHEDRINDLELSWEESDVSNKVDKVAGKGLSTNDYTNADKEKVAKLPEDTQSALDDKVTKITGKGLSTYDFNAEYKNKVDNCASQDALTALAAKVTELETWKAAVLAGSTGVTVEQE